MNTWVGRSRCELQIRAPEPDGHENLLVAEDDGGAGDRELKVRA